VPSVNANVGVMAYTQNIGTEKDNDASRIAMMMMSHERLSFP